MTAPEGRRPLASRGSGWARALARRLARTAVTPNRVSQAGLVAALIAALCFIGVAGATGPLRVALLLGAAGFILLRLLCNMLDGMLAIEAARAAPDGRFWNEVPDRVADILILAGAGYGAGAPALGWAAAAFALLTAYLRELGAGLGAKADFRGPMAKPHRMAVMVGAAVLSCFEHTVGSDGLVLRGALWIAAIGAALTCLRRGRQLLIALREGAAMSDEMSTR